MLAFNGIEGFAKHLTHFFKIHFLVVVKQKHVAIFRGKILKRESKSLAVLKTPNKFVRKRLLIGKRGLKNILLFLVYESRKRYGVAFTEHINRRVARIRE